MSDVAERIEAVAAELRKVAGLVVTRRLVGIRPPAVVLTPPSFAYGAYTADPTDITCVAVIVEAVGDRAEEKLLAWLPQVSEAVHGATDAYVSRAEPGAFQTSEAGATRLPAYFVEITL